MKLCSICGENFEGEHTCSRTRNGQIIRVAPFEVWEEEFEDEMDVDYVKNGNVYCSDYKEDYPDDEFILFHEQRFIRLIKKYNLIGKIKIKVRKGAILIEEVKK